MASFWKMIIQIYVVDIDLQPGLEMVNISTLGYHVLWLDKLIEINICM